MEPQEQMDMMALLGPCKMSERGPGNLILALRKLQVPGNSIVALRRLQVPGNLTWALRKLREPDRLMLGPSKLACAWV